MKKARHQAVPMPKTVEQDFFASKHVIEIFIWRKLPGSYMDDVVLSMGVDGHDFLNITEREGESIRNWLISVGINIKATSKASIIRRLRDFNLTLEFMEQTWLDDTHIVRNYVIKPLLPFERKVEICNEIIKASGLITNICSNPSSPDLEMIKQIRSVCETIQELTDKLDAFHGDKYTQPITSTNYKSLQYRAGQRVFHAKFGEGIVMATKPSGDDLEINVRFDKSGVKTLIASLAKLEIQVAPTLTDLADMPF